MLKSLVRNAIGLTPFRLVRGALNRFQGIDDSLLHLRRLGYAPRLIVDGGAHLGSFALAAHRTFPGAEIHMIEPQPACRAVLEALAARHGFTLHPQALTSQPGTVQFHIDYHDRPRTGGHIPPQRLTEGVVDVAATTLDTLYAARITSADRTLLKLDLEGHEPLALKGAMTMLASVEMLLTEVSFFSHSGEPTVTRLIRLLADSGFDVFDVVALSGRGRDDRLKMGDLLFVRRGSPLWTDNAWR